MTSSNLVDILIALALVVWIVYRQFTWQSVTPRGLWRMPIVLALVGVVMLAQGRSLAAITPLELAVLAGEILVSVAVGATMGSLARFRSRPQEARDVASRKNPQATHDPAVTVIESRTGALGAALWLVLIVVRVGSEIAASHYLHSAFLASTGTILLVVAANRATRSLVLTNRLQHHLVLTA